MFLLHVKKKKTNNPVQQFNRYFDYIPLHRKPRDMLVLYNSYCLWLLDLQCGQGWEQGGASSPCPTAGRLSWELERPLCRCFPGSVLVLVVADPGFSPQVSLGFLPLDGWVLRVCPTENQEKVVLPYRAPVLWVT